jgi:two-component system, NarL family, sensor kinase
MKLILCSFFVAFTTIVIAGTNVVSSLNLKAQQLIVSNVNSAESFANKALQEAKQSNDVYNISYAYSTLSTVKSSNGKANIALDYAEKALEQALTTHDKSIIAKATYNKGRALKYLSEFEQATQLLYNALNTYNQLHDFNNAARCKSSLGGMYQEKEDLPKAEQLLNEVLNNFDKINEVGIKAQTLHTLANVYGMKGEIAKAMHTDSLGLQLFTNNVDKTHLTPFYDNLANCYIELKQYNKGLLYFNKCLQIDSTADNKKLMSDTYMHIAELNVLQHKNLIAGVYFNKALLYSKLSSFKMMEKQIYAAMYRMYRQTNQLDSAIKYLELDKKITSEVLKQKSEDKQNELHIVYETNKKEQEIITKQQEINTKNNQLIIGAITTLLIMILLYLYYKNNIQLREQKYSAKLASQRLLATNNILQVEERERARIASELHDGVGQMMSVIKIKLAKMESSLELTTQQKNEYNTTLTIVDECCAEVRNVSHQMMPATLVNKGLIASLQDLAYNTTNANLKVIINASGFENRVTSTIETNLYRIAQECIHNAIKHGKATNIDIALTNDPDGISVMIEDNGIGFDTTTLHNKTGLGITNIATRLAFIHGSYEINSLPNNGTLVAIYLPVST